MKYKHYFAAMTVALLLFTGCQQLPTATPGKDTSIQALTETQPPAPEITPLTNIVRCDPITLPDDISRYTLAERIGEGFSGIVYNMDHQPTYLHISEDMQTAETFVLTPPEDQEDYSLVYQWFALEDGGIWSIALMESHGVLKPYDPQTDGDTTTGKAGMPLNRRNISSVTMPRTEH